MKYNYIPKLDLNISAIGFGTWPLGGDAYGSVNDDESIAALEYAFDKGVNFFDTANIYGNGHSEKILTLFARGKREKITISSKAGYQDYGKGSQNFSEQFIAVSIHEILKRLKTDYLDIFFLHSPHRELIASGKAHSLLSKLKSSGIIRLGGISVKTADDGLLAVETGQVDLIQVVFNLIDQSAKNNGLLELAYKKKIAIIAKVPLCYGFLTGKYHEGSKFGDNDHRRRFAETEQSEWISRIKAFDQTCDKGGKTLSQLALQFCLAQESITSTIPGMKTVQQVRENLDAATLPLLTACEIKEIEQNNLSLSGSNNNCPGKAA